MSRSLNTGSSTVDTGDEISVAVLFGGGRLWTLREPLEAAGITTISNPPGDIPPGADCIIVDAPGVSLLRKALTYDIPVCYRLRGNYWKAVADQRLGTLRAWLADRHVFSRVDSILTPGPRLHRLTKERVDVRADCIGLPIDPAEWPDVSHSGGIDQLVTLTNFDYFAKVEPITRWAPVVDEWCREHDATWVIGGDGSEADRIARNLDEYPRVTHAGYVDAEGALAKSDVLLHPSRMDIQHPNAVLEGAASRLPVIGSWFGAFRDSDIITTVAEDRVLQGELSQLSDPATREQVADEQLAVVGEHHDPEYIGKQYRRALREVVR